MKGLYWIIGLKWSTAVVVKMGCTPSNAKQDFTKNGIGRQETMIYLSFHCDKMGRVSFSFIVDIAHHIRRLY